MSEPLCKCGHPRADHGEMLKGRCMWRPCGCRHYRARTAEPPLPPDADDADGCALCDGWPIVSEGLCAKCLNPPDPRGST